MTITTQLPLGAESMAERAYQVLRDRLIMMDIAPGDPINEAQLVAELGIGRTPLREALKRLEVDHLVQSYPRRGTFASRVDITELADITEVRQALEPLAAAKAATLQGGSARAGIQATLEAVQQLSGENLRRTLMENDLEVHRLIYQAAGNHHLEQTLIRLDNLATRIWCMALDRLPSIDEHIGEHVALLQAILDGHAQRAQELAREHIVHFEKSVRSVL
ncbi:MULTISPECIES: GntR family transcriptional regulator [Glutamicibacter]|uniref:GntR family transcriptional regulator n=1 Tax=Glutamicibacter TaxID=1742989 RepID=UPI000EF8D83C|nr:MULTISPECIES: GntR family transcriptional regulator [Glutamicibacter]MDV2977870.1 GntR family transcriptional regulator [Actinomycetes bacterium ARC8]RWZ84990.1 GntR family transcriptional regulator [Glutamicibacter sp. HZAU]